MFGDFDCPINASRRFVSISWACCFLRWDWGGFGHPAHPWLCLCHQYI